MIGTNHRKLTKPKTAAIPLRKILAFILFTNTFCNNCPRCTETAAEATATDAAKKHCSCCNKCCNIYCN